MEIQEMANAFSVYYNNITSNQAPGLNDYEISLFLTKAEREIVKDYFTPTSKGNNLNQGFDDSAKRQMDFSTLVKVGKAERQTEFSYFQIDSRSFVFKMPSDMFVVINELMETKNGKQLQVIPLRYDEYTEQMSKTFKRPLKHQAWRLINHGVSDNTTTDTYVEVITNEGDCPCSYKVRYVRMPKPIIIGDLEGLSIEGETEVSDKCELDPNLHEDVVQRAVELAKAAWQGDIATTIQTGQRIE